MFLFNAGFKYKRGPLIKTKNKPKLISIYIYLRPTYSPFHNSLRCLGYTSLENGRKSRNWEYLSERSEPTISLWYFHLATLNQTVK